MLTLIMTCHVLCNVRVEIVKSVGHITRLSCSKEIE